MPLVTCADCKTEHSDEASACPKCGKPNTPASKKKTSPIAMVGAILFGLFIVLCLGFMKVNAEIKQEEELRRINREGNQFAEEQMKRQKAAEEEIKKYKK
jgi:hypothetical protein